MKIGIIGTNWGRVHVGAFRHAGQDVHALMGKDLVNARLVADEDGVSVATVNADDLEPCDVIVVASPTTTHASYLRRFRLKPVLCEKPLLGVVAGPETRQLLKNMTLYVNYAFPFLDSARVVKQLIEEGAIGAPNRILLQVGVNFPFHMPPVPWFLNIALHPLAFIYHLFGTFQLEHAHIGEGVANLSCALSNEGLGLDIAFYSLPTTGMRFDMRFIGDTGFVDLNGGYNPNKDWWFDPVRLNDNPVSEGEYSDLGDIWFRANCRSVATFLDVLKGKRSHREGEEEGLFGADKALALEEMFADIMAAEE